METPARAEVAHNKLLTNIKEEQTSSDESQVKSKAKSRRASVACTSCRDRRIRCVVPTGKTSCLQCERGSATCTIKDDDERRRPISRAYVHSLVERIALLEGLLKDQDLPVPPADHPPETRHRSRNSRENPSSSIASQSSALSLKGSPSSSETTSSPCSSTLKNMGDYRISNKRTSVPHNISNEFGRSSKKTRKDSLVLPTGVKVDSFINDPANPTVLSNELNAFAQTPPSMQTFFWPKTDDYTSGRTTLYSGIQSNDDCTVNNAWDGDADELHGYTHHLTDIEYREAIRLDPRHETIRKMRCGPTNIDFMPFGKGDWSP
ncbi:DNA binding [Ascochyta rabiei]|uniref:DNA binding n=1 Tax=Didymella rabiei TaxID=5454 RepID=A0A162ZSE8_DIDRA|nr:DNA binding [Ascochyta rabiei]